MNQTTEGYGIRLTIHKKIVLEVVGRQRWNPHPRITVLRRRHFAYEERLAVDGFVADGLLNRNSDAGELSLTKSGETALLADAADTVINADTYFAEHLLARRRALDTLINYGADSTSRRMLIGLAAEGRQEVLYMFAERVANGEQLSPPRHYWTSLVKRRSIPPEVVDMLAGDD